MTRHQVDNLNCQVHAVRPKKSLSSRRAWAAARCSFNTEKTNLLVAPKSVSSIQNQSHSQPMALPPSLGVETARLDRGLKL